LPWLVCPVADPDRELLRHQVQRSSYADLGEDGKLRPVKVPSAAHLSR